MAETNIKVCVRIRPIIENEIERGNRVPAWQWEKDTMQLEERFVKKSGPKTAPSFTFDHLYSPNQCTSDLYENVVKNCINKAMEGYHTSVFAYGMTSSGKSFTMNGSEEDPGVIPMAIQDVFSFVESNKSIKFLLRLSYLEIYNENIIDLLAPGGHSDEKIRIMEDTKRATTIIRGVKEEIILSADHAFGLIASCEANRHVGSTSMNEHSSRSHAVVRLIIESTTNGASENNARSRPVRISTMSLIDLAGSESVRLTQATGDRQTEGGFINKSLLTLGHIVSKLSQSATDGRPISHLPYRDSKLTRILQPSLSGNAQIAIICNVTPVQDSIEETQNTLKFAQRAKKIKQNAIMNERLDESALIRKYEREIAELNEKLEAVSKQNAAPSSLEETQELEFAVEKLTRILLNSEANPSKPSVATSPRRKSHQGIHAFYNNASPHPVHPIAKSRLGAKGASARSLTQDKNPPEQPLSPTSLMDIQMTEELRVIQSHLSSLVEKRRIHKGNDASNQTFVESSEQSTTEPTSAIDRNFLEQQIQERDAMLTEVAEYLKKMEIEKDELKRKVKRLEMENQKLRGASPPVPSQTAIPRPTGIKYTPRA